MFGFVKFGILILLVLYMWFCFLIFTFGASICARARACACVSCCVHTLLLLPHTRYIYDATHDIHMLANSAFFGFNFHFLLLDYRNSVHSRF